MGKPREITELSAEGSYAEAAAQIVSIRAREVVDHAEGVLDVEDIERVHDMRVATRRLRAALEIFEPCFPAKPWRAALADVKVLADALGERRDRDVAIEALNSFAAEMPTPDRPGVESLISDLISEQLAANDALAEHVEPDRLAALHEQLMELVAAVKRPPPEEEEEPGAEQDGEQPAFAADEPEGSDPKGTQEPEGSDPKGTQGAEGSDPERTEPETARPDDAPIVAESESASSNGHGEFDRDGG